MSAKQIGKLFALGAILAVGVGRFRAPGLSDSGRNRDHQ